MGLDDREAVLYLLREMQHAGSQAHNAASEDGGLTGPVRDMIFGLNSSVEALIGIIDEIDGLRNDYEVVKERDDVRGVVVVQLARIVNDVKAALDEYDAEPDSRAADPLTLYKFLTAVAKAVDREVSQ